MQLKAPITYNIYNGDKLVFKTKSASKASDYRVTNGKHLSIMAIDSIGNTKKLYADGGMIESKINELYKKSKFINDDFNWKLKLLEMMQDNSIEAYSIYQTLSNEQKEQVLQEQYEVDNDMGSDGDGKLKTTKENLSILLRGAKNGKKYAKGSTVKGNSVVEFTSNGTITVVFGEEEAEIRVEKGDKINAYVDYVNKEENYADISGFSLLDILQFKEDGKFVRTLEAQDFGKYIPYSSVSTFKNANDKNGVAMSVDLDLIKIGDKYAKGSTIKSGAVKKRSLMSMANLVVSDLRGEKINDWYKKTYPTDDLGEYINDITFEDFWNSTNSDNIYNVIGVGDSIIRERLFEHLSEIYGVTYNDVYDRLFGDKFANGGVLNGNYLDTISNDKKNEILKNIANHYGISVAEAKAEVIDADAEMLYEYIANDKSLRMSVYDDFEYGKFTHGGGVGEYGTYKVTFRDNTEDMLTWSEYAYANSEQQAISRSAESLNRKYPKYDFSKMKVVEVEEGDKFADGGNTSSGYSYSIGGL